MIHKKQKRLEQLKLLYLFIFIVSAVFVVPAHIFSPPSFMAFRFPHYLEMMGPFLGVSWPLTFEIYHWILLIIGAIETINVLGLFFSNMESMAKLSSLIGLFLFSSMILFFFFVFLRINTPTAVIYGLYSIVLLIVDLLTFKVLIRRQKEA